jgi:signal transduction histidine kinase
MATIVSVNNGHAFRILDNSFATHAEWHLEKNHAIPVTVGDRILLEWDEMFNIGSGTRIEALYHFLKPGHYELRANILDAAGHPTATTTNLTLILPRPHWQNPWLWAGGLLVFSVTVIWSVRRIVSVKVKHHVERMEHAHLLEQERLRITRNIHDDLGARLTHVSLISSLAENETDSSPVREKFEQISAMTREMVASLYETVWTINPANDTLESLVTFLCQLLQKLCNPANIRSRINVPAIPANPHVSGDLRHHLNLAVKEAINNAIKHSGAQVIELGIRLEHDTLTIWVKDNGKGFDQGAVKEGYGIANLQSRMASISARALINSAPNQGTTVTLEDIKI